jgi:hypothetical protein
VSYWSDKEMLVKELRSLYMKETNCDLYQSPFFVGHNFGMIDAEYIKWLEQKLICPPTASEWKDIIKTWLATQPYPKCERTEKLLLEYEVLKELVEEHLKQPCPKCEYHKASWDKLKRTIEENNLWFRAQANDLKDPFYLCADHKADVYDFLLGLMQRMEEDHRAYEASDDSAQQ